MYAYRLDVAFQRKKYPSAAAQSIVIIWIMISRDIIIGLVGPISN